MRRLALLTALLLAACAPAASARLASPPRIGGAMGVLPAAGATPRPSPAIPVVYHGGPVMRDVTIHTVFWAPAGYRFSGPPSDGTLGYMAMIQQFFTDAAAGAGSGPSILSVLPEYSDALGPGSTQLHYDAATDTIVDADPYPDVGHDCPSPAGVAVCLSDRGIRKELDAQIAADDPSGRGLHDLWFVFLPPDVDECLALGSCGTSSFAGYHSLAPGSGGAFTIYSVIPEPSIEATQGPGQDPQGNPVAEIAIDTAAHELLEAMTNPDGSGWMDPNGFETADKCENGPQYGTPLGFAPDGSPYNQLINGHQYLIQMIWSNRRSGCVPSEPATGKLPTPPPQVYLSQFSGSIRGATGIARKGVEVAILLERAGEAVAAALGGSRADGTWGPISLSDPLGFPHAVGDDRDVLAVSYGSGGPAPDLILTGNGGDPFNQAGWTGWYELDSGFQVTSGARGGRVLVAPCSQTGVLRLRVGGVLEPSPTQSCDPQAGVSRTPTPEIGGGRTVKLSSDDNRALFAENPYGALVRLDVQAGEPNSLTSLANSQVPFDPSGFPRCTANLENGHVSCDGLVARAMYALIRARGNTRVLVRAGGDGVLLAHGFAGLRGLRRGDVLTLRNGAGRVLTKLHVAHLRVDIAGAETVIASGSCEVGDYYGPGLAAPPKSHAASTLGVAGAGNVCPLTGDATGLPTDRIEQIDEFSGGVTETRVPVLDGFSPADDATVHGAFTALAGAALPASHGAVAGADARVALTIRPARDQRTVFRSRNVNTEAGVRVPALSPGVYRVTWQVIDVNGDTRTTHTRFIEAG